MQVIKLNGDHLTFKGRVYGSVGIEYRIEPVGGINLVHT